MQDEQRGDRKVDHKHTFREPRGSRQIYTPGLSILEIVLQLDASSSAGHFVRRVDSITGTKSEDTILVTTRGIEIITPAKNWPMVGVKTLTGKILRPDILPC